MVEELSSLTLNQKHLLHCLSIQPSSAPFSKDYLNYVNLQLASVQNALGILLNKGLVIKLTDVYCVLDPTFKAYFEL